MADQKTIVVVEDERDTADMLAEMVNIIGFQVVKCYGGARALAVISEKKPVAVVLDVMMPDLSGLEVLRFIRTSNSKRELPSKVSLRSTQKS